MFSLSVKRPDRGSGRSQVIASAHCRRKLLVGQELIDRRTPEVTIAQVVGRQRAAAGPLELHDDLVAVVNVAGLRGRTAGCHSLADPAVGGVVQVGDRLGDLPVGRLVGYLTSRLRLSQV